MRAAARASPFVMAGAVVLKLHISPTWKELSASSNAAAKVMESPVPGRSYLPATGTVISSLKLLPPSME